MRIHGDVLSVNMVFPFLNRIRDLTELVLVVYEDTACAEIGISFVLVQSRMISLR